MQRLRDRELCRCSAGQPLRAPPRRLMRPPAPCQRTAARPRRLAGLGPRRLGGPGGLGLSSLCQTPDTMPLQGAPKLARWRSKDASARHDERTLIRPGTALHPAYRVHPCRLRSIQIPPPATRDRHPAASPRAVGKGRCRACKGRHFRGAQIQCGGRRHAGRGSATSPRSPRLRAQWRTHQPHPAHASGDRLLFKPPQDLETLPRGGRRSSGDLGGRCRTLAAVFSRRCRADPRRRSSRRRFGLARMHHHGRLGRGDRECVSLPGLLFQRHLCLPYYP
jgi:hypothetical protein